MRGESRGRYKMELLSVCRFCFVSVLLVAAAGSVWAGGESEAAGTDRGAYVAEQGRIIPPEVIWG